MVNNEYAARLMGALPSPNRDSALKQSARNDT